MNEILFLSIAVAAALFKIGAIALGVLWAMKSLVDSRSVRAADYLVPEKLAWPKHTKRA